MVGSCRVIVNCRGGPVGAVSIVVTVTAEEYGPPPTDVLILACMLYFNSFF